jgi:hypothetical protein
MKSGSPIGDHTGLWQRRLEGPKRDSYSSATTGANPRENHTPGPASSRIGVSEGGEKPHKGTAFSRERSHYLGRAIL